MPQQDPWRKAYNLSRARTPADIQPGTRTGPAPSQRRQPKRWPWVMLAVAVVGGGAYWLWEQRGVLIPRYAEKLPEPVARQVEQTPLPRQEIDVALLDGGLGLGLAIGGDYLNLVESTSGSTEDGNAQSGLGWKLVTTGSDRLRLSASGLKVNVAGGRISSWNLDVKEVFASKQWDAFRKGLVDAGISPDLNWRIATGEASMPEGLTEQHLTGRGGFQFGGNPATTSYTLVFRDGWLQRIEAGLSTGELAEPVELRPEAGPELVPMRPEPLNPVLPDPPHG